MRFERADALKKCPFCYIEGTGPLIEETKHARVVKARYPYDLWEFRGVTDHLLIIPKQHATSLSALSRVERADIMDLIAKYEAENYNIYARAVKSVQRTEVHQHTHLIKTKDRHAKAVLYIKKPHLVAKV